MGIITMFVMPKEANIFRHIWTYKGSGHAMFIRMRYDGAKAIIHLKLKHGGAMRYNTEKSIITSRLGILTSVRVRRKVHTAFKCMGGHIRDIYIDGILHSYVCVTRRQIKSKKALFSRMNNRANIATNGIRIRFKPTNYKVHRLRHRGKPAKIQVTTFY